MDTLPQKSELVQARVTPEDKEAIRAAAAELGLSVSEYLRLLASSYRLALERRN